MMWRTWFIIGSAVAVVLAYRVFVVLNRDIPGDIEKPNVVRWLDEAGRIGNTLAWLCHQLGIEHASWPVKIIVNFGFKILLNGISNKIVNTSVHYTTVDNVPVTIFVPDTILADDKYTTMVYFHGGGWTWFSVDVYSGFLANLATRNKLQIVAVEYRKAPEHIFPAAFEDCLTVTKGLLKRTGQFKIKNKIILAGDGSGGNLAAAVSQTIKEKQILMQILINPALQLLDFETPSYQDNKNTLPGISSAYRNGHHWLSYAGISKDFLQIALENAHVSKNIRNSIFSTYVDSEKYLPSYHQVTKRKTKRDFNSNFIVSSAFQHCITDPRLTPMMAVDVKGVPNAYVITSQYDVFRDEAIMFTHRLFDNKVKVKLEHYSKGFHGFFLFSGPGPIKFDVSKQALDDLVEFIDMNVHGGAEHSNI